MKRINNQLWTDRSFIGKIIKNEKGFTSCVFKSGLAISKCASFGSYYMDSLWSDFLRLQKGIFGGGGYRGDFFF